MYIPYLIYYSKWRALFQNAIRAISKGWDALPILNLSIVFWKSSFHMWNIYVYISVYTPIWRALFQNMISKFGIGIANYFLEEWRLSRFEKKNTKKTLQILSQCVFNMSSIFIQYLSSIYPTFIQYLSNISQHPPLSTIYHGFSQDLSSIYLIFIQYLPLPNIYQLNT